MILTLITCHLYCIALQRLYYQRQPAHNNCSCHYSLLPDLIVHPVQ